MRRCLRCHDKKHRLEHWPVKSKEPTILCACWKTGRHRREKVMQSGQPTRHIFSRSWQQWTTCPFRHEAAVASKTQSLGKSGHGLSTPVLHVSSIVAQCRPGSRKMLLSLSTCAASVQHCRSMSSWVTENATESARKGRFPPYFVRRNIILRFQNPNDNSRTKLFPQRRLYSLLPAFEPGRKMGTGSGWRLHEPKDIDNRPMPVAIFSQALSTLVVSVLHGAGRRGNCPDSESRRSS